MIHRLQCQKRDYRTPFDVAQGIRHVFDGIALDPCTSPDNHLGAARYCSLPGDGRAIPWEDATYCNPPFGDQVESWMGKTALEARHGWRVGLMLSVSRTETRYFQSLLLRHPSLTAVLYFKGKLRFDEGPGGMLASWMLWFNTSPCDVRRWMGHLGTVHGVDHG